MQHREKAFLIIDNHVGVNVFDLQALFDVVVDQEERMWQSIKSSLKEEAENLSI
jgi:23S rRNA A2030 N6-methylase RlmJ